VSFRQRQKNFHTTVVAVKGSECEAARVKEATVLLMEHFCPPGDQYGQAQTVSVNMEISPQHHPIVLGKVNKYRQQVIYLCL